MRTIRTKVYFFNELSEKAKQQAIEKYRDSGMIHTSHIYDDAHKTVKEFNEIFGTKEGYHSWLDIKTGHINDNILELKGLRLRTYIINNYWNRLFKGKFYSCKSDKQIKHKRIESIFYKNSERWGNYYYSAITFENSCVLTGMCYDDDILNPIYKFIQHPNNSTTFEELLNECIENMGKVLRTEEDYMYSPEYITEEIEANEYEFTEDGTRI